MSLSSLNGGALDGIAENGIVKNETAKETPSVDQPKPEEKQESLEKSDPNQATEAQEAQETPNKSDEPTKEIKTEPAKDEVKAGEIKKPEQPDKAAENKEIETKSKESQEAELQAALAGIVKDVPKIDMPAKEKKKENAEVRRSTAKNLDLNMQIKIEPSLQKLRLDESKKKELTFEECLENGRQMMIKFLDNQFEEVIGILEDQSDISIIHKLGSAAVRFFDSILSMDKEKMTIALTAMREAADFSDRHRKKTGYINYLISPDYNTFTDVECHAEVFDWSPFAFL